MDGCHEGHPKWYLKWMNGIYSLSAPIKLSKAFLAQVPLLLPASKAPSLRTPSQLGKSRWLSRKSPRVEQSWLHVKIYTRHLFSGASVVEQTRVVHFCENKVRAVPKWRWNQTLPCFERQNESVRLQCACLFTETLLVSCN